MHLWVVYSLYISGHQDQPLCADMIYNCRMCDRKFLYKSQLRMHEIIHTGLKPHVCRVCGRGFNRKWNLKSHMYSHAKDWHYKDHLLLALKAPITTAADDKFCEFFSIFDKNKIWYSRESSASRRFSWNIIPYWLLLKKCQNLKLTSAANYRWRFKG